MTLTRAAALGLAALAGYAALAIAVPAQASAATAYRYWAYYVAPATSTSSSWQYSQRGPAYEYPVDGEVQGWRFAVQVDAASGLLPRAAPDFAKLCASSPAKAGELRVGVVIDFGLTTDEPAHEQPPAGVVRGCVYVHDGKTGADALQAAAAVRIGTGSDAGLVCGIDGYPKTQCAVAAAANPAPPLATPSSTPSDSSPRPTATTQATTTPAATTPSVTVAPVTSAAAISPAASPARSAEQSPVLAQTPAGPPSAVPAPATASVLSLAALRSSTRHGHGALTGTIAGIILIVILGAGALWRGRVRGR
jgi:hypothetical protein